MANINVKDTTVQVIRLQFPCEIRQLDGRTLEVRTQPYDGPVLADGLLDVVAPDLSAAEQDRLMDDVAHFIHSEALRRSIRIM